MILFGVAVVLFALFVIGRWQRPAQLRNATLLLGALGFAGLGILQPIAMNDLRDALRVFFFLGALLTLALFILAIFLIANGLTMWRLEGHSLGNTLSLIAGVGIMAQPVLSVVLVALLGPVGIVLVFAIALVSGYVAIVFGVFLTSSMLYAFVRPSRAPSAVIILGSGLIRGEVPPLLRGRLDRALAAYQASPPATSTVLVPSGGQGPDEPRAEAAAMAGYLLEKGVPAAVLRPEARSRNTRENLLFSRALLDEDEAREVLIVTSDYHVMRAALLARSILPGARVAGSRTAAYFVPSAFLREFAAVFRAHLWWHIGIAGLTCSAIVYAFASLVIAVVNT